MNSKAVQKGDQTRFETWKFRKRVEKEKGLQWTKRDKKGTKGTKQERNRDRTGRNRTKKGQKWTKQGQNREQNRKQNKEKKGTKLLVLFVSSCLLIVLFWPFWSLLCPLFITFWSLFCPFFCLEFYTLSCTLCYFFVGSASYAFFLSLFSNALS